MCILLLDLYKIRRDRVALPFCQITLKAQKPSKIPQNPKTIGEHIRKKRVELNLLQKYVAKIIGTTEETIYNWENNRSNPKVMFYPKIIDFLGYNPVKNSTKSLRKRIIFYRKAHGLSQRKLAEILNIDQSTLRRWERNLGKPSKKLSKKLDILSL